MPQTFPGKSRSDSEIPGEPASAECILTPGVPGLLDRLPGRKRRQNIGVDISGGAVHLLRVETPARGMCRLAEYARIPVMETGGGIPEICHAIRPALKKMTACAPSAGVWLSAEYRQIYILHDSTDLERDKDPGARILARLPCPPAEEERGDWIVDFIRLSPREKKNADPGEDMAPDSFISRQPENHEDISPDPVIAGAISAAEVGAFTDRLEEICRLDGVIMKPCAIMNLHAAGLLPAADGMVVELAVGWREYRISFYSLAEQGDLLHYRRMRGGWNSMVEAVENGLEEAFPDAGSMGVAADTLLMRFLDGAPLDPEGKSAGRISREQMTEWLRPALRRAAWQVRQSITQMEWPIPFRLFVSGEAAASPAVRAILKDALDGQAEVHALDPLSHEKVDASAVSLPESPSKRIAMATALGLALPRGRERMLNFLISYEGREKEQAHQRYEWAAGVLSLFLIFIFSVTWGWMEGEIRRESRVLASEKKSLEEKKGQSPGELTDEMLTAENLRLVSIRRRKRRHIMRMAPAGILRDLAARLPEGVKLSRMTIQAVSRPDARGDTGDMISYSLHLDAHSDGAPGISDPSPPSSPDAPGERCRLAVAGSPYISGSPVLHIRPPAPGRNNNAAAFSIEAVIPWPRAAETN